MLRAAVVYLSSWKYYTQKYLQSLLRVCGQWEPFGRKQKSCESFLMKKSAKTPVLLVRCGSVSKKQHSVCVCVCVWRRSTHRNVATCTRLRSCTVRRTTLGVSMLHTVTTRIVVVCEACCVGSPVFLSLHVLPLNFYMKNEKLPVGLWVEKFTYH